MMARSKVSDCIEILHSMLGSIADAIAEQEIAKLSQKNVIVA
jgi:hypothetical protein